jgi:hypothetical protein
MLCGCGQSIAIWEARVKQYPPVPCAAPLNVIGTHLVIGVSMLPPRHSLSARQVSHGLLLPLAVPVQVFVVGLQLLVPQAVSLLAVHSTQVPAEQTFLPAICAQSASVTQPVQVFVVSSQ